MRVVIGVDSHKATLAAAAVDEQGRLIDQTEFPNDKRGHQKFCDWALELGEVIRVGIECSGSFGASLGRSLSGTGLEVREVPTSLAHRETKRKPSLGKSDPTDALAIARVALREDQLPLLKESGAYQDLRLLSEYRQQLVQDRTQAANRVHKDLMILRPGYQSQVPKLTQKWQITKALYLIRGDQSIRAELVRRRIRDLRRLDGLIAEITDELKKKLEASGTTLTDQLGISYVTAAKILGEVGDPARLRSKAAFAQMTGTAPLQASSGATKRHRLNRGGNRYLNCSLHVIAINRCRLDPQTKAYIQKKCAEGKTKKEALRCLKRHLSNVIYQELARGLNQERKVA